MPSRLSRESASFRGTWKGRVLWAGGYFEGDPLDRDLRSKLASGAECFLMVADYDKATRAAEQADSILASRTAPDGKRGDLIRAAWKLSRRDELPWSNMADDEDHEPRPGRWYNAGTTRVADLLDRLGYVVRDQDMGLTYRDPVVHFVRP